MVESSFGILRWWIFDIHSWFSKKQHRLASTASDRKGAKIQYDISWLYQKNKFLQNINIKLNSRILLTLKSSVVIFQALEPLQPRWPHWPLQPQRPLQPQKPYFTKKLRGPDGWIVPGTKMTNTVPFLLNKSSKIQIFTDIL